jgi:hypothetical protein
MYTDPSAGASGSCASTSACFSVACVPAGVPGGSVSRTTPALLVKGGRASGLSQGVSVSARRAGTGTCAAQRRVTHNSCP